MQTRMRTKMARSKRDLAEIGMGDGTSLRVPTLQLRKVRGELAAIARVNGSRSAKARRVLSALDRARVPYRVVR